VEKDTLARRSRRLFLEVAVRSSKEGKAC